MNNIPPLARRARPADAADFARLMSDSGVFANLMQLPYPTEEMWRARLEEQLQPARSDLHLVAEQDGRVIASLGLHPAVQVRRRHVAMLGISVDAAFQRQGLGTMLMQAACDYADQWAGILRIELTVFVDNLGAQALYRKFDFRYEGTHSGFALRHGVYADVHSMARWHPHPPQTPQLPQLPQETQA